MTPVSAPTPAACAGCEKNLTLINAFSAFSIAWAFVPVLLLFAQDEIGVGYQAVIGSEAVFAATCVLFDVPTGWISDVWKRKYTLALGASFNAVGSAVLLFADNVWLLFLSQAIIGIGISLFNGTHTALLYDSLAVLGREGEYRAREGKRQALGLYGYALSGVASGFLYPLNHFLPVWITVICFAITCATTFFMAEPPRAQREASRHPARDIVKALRDVVKGHGEVSLAILLAAVVFSATKAISWTQQPYYKALELPVYLYGILMSAGWFLSGLSSHLAPRLDGRIDSFRWLEISAGAAVVLCLGAAAVLGYHGIVLLMLGGSVVYGSTSPRVNEIINRYAASDNRATLLSTQTFLASLLFIPLSSLVGWVADAVGIRAAIACISLWIAAGAYGLYRWKRAPRAG